MKAADIHARWKKEPFEPFTLVMAHNDRHNVLHRGMLVVGHSMLAYGISESGDFDLVADRVIPLSLDQVLRIEPLQNPKPGS